MTTQERTGSTEGGDLETAVDFLLSDSGGKFFSAVI